MYSHLNGYADLNGVSSTGGISVTGKASVESFWSGVLPMTSKIGGVGWFLSMPVPTSALSQAALPPIGAFRVAVDVEYLSICFVTLIAPWRKTPLSFPSTCSPTSNMFFALKRMHQRRLPWRRLATQVLLEGDSLSSPGLTWKGAPDSSHRALQHGIQLSSACYFLGDKTGDLDAVCSTSVIPCRAGSADDICTAQCCL